MFKTKDMSVQAIAIGPDGSVYAATLPDGKVYRIPAGSTDLDAEKATVVFDPAKLEGAKARRRSQVHLGSRLRTGWRALCSDRRACRRVSRSRTCGRCACGALLPE